MMCTALALAAAAGCKNESRDGAITAPTVQEQERQRAAELEQQHRENQAQQDLDRAKANLAEARVDFQRATEARIAQLDAKIEELEARGDAKSKQIAADFRKRRDDARAKLAEAGERTESNWEQFKADVSASWDQLEKDVSNAIDEID